ncbi:MAG: hypothetical protein ACRCUY_06845 [Thermoguttaceae bacterium]
MNADGVRGRQNPPNNRRNNRRLTPAARRNKTRQLTLAARRNNRRINAGAHTPARNASAKTQQSAR